MNPLDLDPTVIALMLGMGCVGGFLAGLLGIGGGMLLVPALTWLGTRLGMAPDYGVKMAVATSLATIVFTSVSSVRAHHRRGAVRWDIVWRLAPGIVIGSLLGAQLVRWIPSAALALAFAVFVGYSATQMFIDRKPKPSRQLPAGAGMAGAGSGIGVLSALVGAGGGFISVPFMVWCNVAIHNAVATSAALGFPIALAGTVGHLLAGTVVQGEPPGAIGYIHVPALVLIASASVLLAPVGAWAAHRLNVKQLKRAFAVLLYLLAAYMTWRAISL
ncbi:MAG: sulfite exporter TauE/SafE family protein [Rubrivivax sp.]|nr:sulfite exporter TauE/SafE family protein [Rubrivivax sp.]